MKRITLLLVISLIVVGTVASYIFYQYSILEARYALLLKEVEGLTYRVNILIDYGNGTRVWYNSTLVPIGWSLYNATLKIAKVKATYFPQYDAYFVDSINGVGENKPPEKASWYWMIWLWDKENLAWKLSEVSSDKYLLKKDDIVAWVFQDTSIWPPKPPS